MVSLWGCVFLRMVLRKNIWAETILDNIFCQGVDWRGKWRLRAFTLSRAACCYAFGYTELSMDAGGVCQADCLISVR